MLGPVTACSRTILGGLRLQAGHPPGAVMNLTAPGKVFPREEHRPNLLFGLGERRLVAPLGGRRRAGR